MTEPAIQPASLSSRGRAFLETPRFAVLATINPDGTPHQAVVWYLLEGDEIVVNSLEGRRWPENLRRDPRISLTMADNYDFVSLAGTVTVDDDLDRARADIAAMCRLYHADDPDEAEREIESTFSKQRRVSFRLRPGRIYEHFD